MFSLFSVCPAASLSGLRRLLWPALLLLCSVTAEAAHHKTGHPALWALDNTASTLSFVSVKSGNVAEAHSFGALEGGLSVKSGSAGVSDGEVSIRIDLASVNTNIVSRDQRMREHLFETLKFPAAIVQGRIPLADYLALPVGTSVESIQELTLDLHGVKVPFAAEILVSRLSDSRIVVASTKPLVIGAANFGLAAGLEILRELAGLPSISTAVPVSFVLTFNRTPQAQ